MLRARVAVGACAAGALAAGAVLLEGGSTPRAQPGVSCQDTESTYTTDSLHDIRSFADAMAIVRAVKQTIPPPPRGPEGYAGLIGRTVSVRVEYWVAPADGDCSTFKVQGLDRDGRVVAEHQATCLNG